MEVFDWLYFAHPSFLLLLPIVLLLYWLTRRQRGEASQLSSFIDPKLLAHLVTEKVGKTIPSWIGLLTACLFIIGIAGVSWHKKPDQSFIAPDQTIIILDQSLSMYATDVKPNRLTRLKQKVRDLLNQIQEGEIALTAYAGDAYVISPFSQDKNTLTHFLLALDPLIMPLYGSDLVAAFRTSLNLITNPQQKTNIILFTDDVQSQEIGQIKSLLSDYNVAINVITFGTSEGSTITLPNGQFLQTEQGVIKVALPEQELITLASQLQGQYFNGASLSSQDIRAIVEDSKSNATNFTSTSQKALQWQATGHWFALPFLLWLLYQFRAGVFLSVLLIVSTPHSTKSYASPLDWFATPDQKAQKLVDQGDWQKAQNLFEDPQWQAASQYALENYEVAANMLENITNPHSSAEFFYNKGNSFALSGRLDKAIDAYEEALRKRQDFPEAQANLDYLKQQLDQEQKPQQQNKQQDSDDKNKSDSDSNNQQEDGSQEEKQQSDSDSDNQEEPQESQPADQDAQQKPEQEKPEQEKPEPISQDSLSREDQIAMDQWMRQIQDDPGGLLKRKLWYLHREKRAENSYRQQDGQPIW